MGKMKKSTVGMALGLGALLAAKETSLFPILKSAVALGKQPGDFYLVPTNQLLRPWGEVLQIPGRPVDLAYDSKKATLAILNTRSIVVADGMTGIRKAEIRTGPTSYAGLAFRPGDTELWASLTARSGPDGIAIVPISETGAAGEAFTLKLPGHPLPTGIAFSGDGKLAYVALSRNNTLAVIDAVERKVVKEVEVGMAPFDVVLGPGEQIFVSNRGGRRPKSGDVTAPSSGSEVVTNAETGSTASGTVSVANAKTFQVQEVAVGLAPSALVLSPDKTLLLVANGHSDTVSLLNTATLARTDIAIPVWPGRRAGSQPIGAAFSPDAKRIYVACGGTNAIAVLTQTGAQWKMAGAIPTGYFPTAVEVDLEDRLQVLNLKGFANTDNRKGAFKSRQYIGTLSHIPAVTDVQISAATREVVASNHPQFEPACGI